MHHRVQRSMAALLSGCSVAEGSDMELTTTPGNTASPGQGSFSPVSLKPSPSGSSCFSHFLGSITPSLVIKAQGPSLM